MTTPRTRFVKTPNPTKYSARINTKLGVTTPRRVRTVRSLEDEDLPPGFSRIDAVDSEHITEYHSSKRHKSSDSEDARAGPSGISDSSDSYNKQELSIVAHFDELMVKYDLMSQNELDFETYLMEFVQKQIQVHALHKRSMDECKRLQDELDKANTDIGDLSNKLNIARKLLDKEKKARREAEVDRNFIEKQMALARELLFNDQLKQKLPDDTREKLAFLNNASSRSSMGQYYGPNGRLNTISEINTTEMNSTGSLLSDLSFSRSEDDLDTSAVHSGRAWMKHRPAPPIVEEPSTKKRRSSGAKAVEISINEKIIATTTVSVQKDGPITATSVIESVPQETQEVNIKTNTRRESLKELNQNDNMKTPKTPYYGIDKLWSSSSKIHNNNNINDNYGGIKHHNFAQKAMVRPGICGPCNKRIKFGKIYVKCKDCRGVCHVECKEKLPMPCIPQINTPTQKGAIGTIADYAPTIPPMVPALIIHCVNEVEIRGLNEIGLYRVPGSERDVKLLKEKFLCGKGYPILNDIDIHVICGVIKDFLRSLQEPIITQALWKEFISASEVREVAQVPAILYGAIVKLPAANRDTLAYILLHLQKVSQSKECKMPVGNLAKVFGPTIVGYSSQDLNPSVMLTETRQQAVVMEYLLNLPADFWSQYVNIHTPVRTGTLHQTPSTDSLLMQNGNKGFFNTPYGVKSVQSMRKPKKFFGTPPYK